MRKVFSMVLVAVLVNLVCTPGNFAAQSKRKETLAEKVKAGIATLGTGANAQISVTLNDGRKIKGNISEVHDEDFVVANPAAAAPSTVSYVDVKEIKGQNLSTGSGVTLPARNGLRNGLIAAAVSLTRSVISARACWCSLRAL